MKDTKESLALISSATQLPFRLLIRYAKLARSQPEALDLQVLHQVRDFLTEWSESDLEALRVAYDLKQLQLKLNKKLHCFGSKLDLATRIARTLKSS